MPPGLYLSQGSTQHCVGFMGAGFIAAEGSQAPIDATVDNDLGHTLYYEAKVYDGEPLEENGSCLRSLAKALKARGVIDAYSLTQDFVAADSWVENWGCVGLGVYWWTGMFSPDIGGRIHPTGKREGGHAILWRAKDQLYDNRLPNSWGRGWGVDGECYLSDLDMNGLLQDRGEALLMVKLAANYRPAPVKKGLCHFGKAMKRGRK